MGEIITRVRPPMLDHFVITPEKATEKAQELHNELDENGDISEGKIIDYLMDEYTDLLWEWFDQHIDFDKIREDDADLRELLSEKQEAEKGEY